MLRMYRVALTGDISKMYREVQLSEPDRQLHCFLWRAQPTNPISDYQMNRMTFGVASSPHLAVRTLQQTAQDHGSQHPKASWHVHHSFYVDDLLSGVDTPEAAVQLHDELRSMLLQGGFDLRGSSDDVLNHINPELLEKLPRSCFPPLCNISQSFESGVELRPGHHGHQHLPSHSIHLNQTEMKILYQQLWEKLGWDNTVPEPYRTKQQDWRTQLSILSDIQIPRCYFSEEKAYAAVVYLRATYPNMSISDVQNKGHPSEDHFSTKTGTAGNPCWLSYSPL